MCLNLYKTIPDMKPYAPLRTIPLIPGSGGACGLTFRGFARPFFNKMRRLQRSAGAVAVATRALAAED